MLDMDNSSSRLFFVRWRKIHQEVEREWCSTWETH